MCLTCSRSMTADLSWAWVVVPVSHSPCVLMSQAPVCSPFAKHFPRISGFVSTVSVTEKPIAPVSGSTAIAAPSARGLVTSWLSEDFCNLDKSKPAGEIVVVDQPEGESSAALGRAMTQLLEWQHYRGLVVNGNLGPLSLRLKYSDPFSVSDRDRAASQCPICHVTLRFANSLSGAWPDARCFIAQMPRAKRDREGVTVWIERSHIALFSS